MASSKKLASIPSIQKTPLFDEEEWVIQIRSSLEEEVKEDDIKTTVSIFCVPKTLLSEKPEAYVPQLFAFGPYHHWRQNLYDMERYKLDAARRTQARLKGLKLQDLVEQFMQHEYKIRCHYHKYLDLTGETLAWMMALDASYLLEFLRNFADNANDEAAQANKEAAQKTRSYSKRVENDKMRTGFNIILRDVAMLENQMPLFLLRKLLAIQFSSKEVADTALSEILVGFKKQVSPFKRISENSPLFAAGNNDMIVCHAHLLEVLYYTIIPKPNQLATEIQEIGEENGDTDANPKELELGDTGSVKKILDWMWNCLSGINGGPVGFIKRILGSKPVMLLVQLPWKVITALPIMSIIKKPVENYFSNLISSDKSKHDDVETNQAYKPPSVEEITIPSVSELVRSGVKFLPTKEHIMKVEFDTKNVTLYLPVVSLDVNTEVILRNLVAYEASVVSGPLVFTRYTELMYGIIDTEEDVKLLREKGIIVNCMKSDREAAELWNGMSKSVRLTKVGFLDKVIEDVNKYHGSRWRVKSREFMKKYVFGSWQILTFLAAALLLFLTCVQAFCSVYSCSSHLKNITDMSD